MHVSQKEGVGFLTFALNKNVDYEKCAVLWGLSLKATQRNNIQTAVIVNDAETCRQDLHDVFDYVISLPKRKVVNNMHYEADLLKLTPFKETIKMECDMLVPCDMAVWMHTFRTQDLYITGHVVDHNHKKANDTKQRKFLQVNALPNVYNGLYYVRVTRETDLFFKQLDKVFNNWHTAISKYRLWKRHEPSTDFAMSIALANLEMDRAVSNTALPTFVHNKRYCVGDWKHHAVVDPNNIIVNGTKIQYPWHYHDKSLATEKLISKYKQYV